MKINVEAGSVDTQRFVMYSRTLHHTHTSLQLETNSVNELFVCATLRPIYANFKLFCEIEWTLKESEVEKQIVRTQRVWKAISH